MSRQPRRSAAAGAGAGSGKNFTKYETKRMLEKVREHLPMGQMQWQTTTDAYNEGVGPDRLRDFESLRNKFKKLKNFPKPTGDPTCPSPVKAAKRIQREIEARAAVTELGSEDEDADDGTFEG